MEEPKVGVYVCNCGVNIGGIVRVPEVVAYAKTLPFVTYVEENLFTCSQDTQDKMAAVIRQQGLNRVVVAACTPRTHEPLFRNTMRHAGLNPYLFELANIREQDAWVHQAEPQAATEKAKKLVGMSVARARLLEPLYDITHEVVQRALVIGGGLAGLLAGFLLPGRLLLRLRREAGREPDWEEHRKVIEESRARGRSAS